MQKANMMTPRQVIEKWVEAFNGADVEGLMKLYHKNAINHQVAYKEYKGEEEIRTLFSMEFARADMTCIIEQILESGDWGILEWKDPLGLRGCGFFKIVEGQIILQRGYFDQLSFYRQQGIPLPTE